MEKHFRIVPRGIGLVIGCCTFPTWNGFPGFFADLATGNAVVVKPHPAAILPLALTVKIAREVLAEAGFDPNVVTLVAHAAGDDVAQKLALRPDVRLIDFTGSAANGNWLEANARQAQVFTEKSGRQPDRRRLGRRLQGRRAQRRVLAVALHRADVHGAAEHLRAEGRHRHGRTGTSRFDQVAAAIAEGVQKLLADPARAVEILGAVVNDGVMKRLEAARSLGADRARHAGDRASALPQARRSARRSSSGSAPPTRPSISRNGSVRSPS